MTLISACQGEGAPAANQVSAPDPKAAPKAEEDVGAAQRLVRERLGNPQGLTFASPLRTASEGVTIICGDFSRAAGATHRYIVVGGEEAFVEPQMAPGEMDRVFAEFCREGSGNRPATAAPQGNAS